MRDLRDAHPRADYFIATHAPVNGALHCANGEQSRDQKYQCKRRQRGPLLPSKASHCSMTVRLSLIHLMSVRHITISNKQNSETFRFHHFDRL